MVAVKNVPSYYAVVRLTSVKSFIAQASVIKC
jgi:hypothetical protein